MNYMVGKFFSSAFVCKRNFKQIPFLLLEPIFYIRQGEREGEEYNKYYLQFKLKLRETISLLI